jgi:hypothetical protein
MQKIKLKEYESNLFRATERRNERKRAKEVQKP